MRHPRRLRLRRLRLLLLQFRRLLLRPRLLLQRLRRLRLLPPLRLQLQYRRLRLRRPLLRLLSSARAIPTKRSNTLSTPPEVSEVIPASGWRQGSFPFILLPQYPSCHLRPA